jgi:iron complex outermembrane receptor protein
VNPKHRQLLLLPKLLFAGFLLQVLPVLAAPPESTAESTSTSGKPAATPLGPDDIPEVVVTSQRRAQPVLQHAGNIAQIDLKTLEWLRAQHIHEVMNRVAGAWLVRGSGQEHQTAIRSPVLGGGGACAGFLPLEDSIPVRPPGFCNISQFIELFTEEARSIEVVRGPGNALYGSNALHGTINVLMPMPRGGTPPHVSFEAGANEFARASALIPFDTEAPWLAAAEYAHDGGYRDSSGYRQAKLHLKRQWSPDNGEFTLGFTATSLDQDSAGFIIGEGAYKDPAVNRSNPDPNAYRNAESQRLYGIWRREWGGFDLDVRPYLRHSEMDFLHYERPGKPEEENGQHSGGAMVSLTSQSDSRTLIFGVDLDWASAYLRQTQSGPTEGNPRQRETFPEGKHYDYEVDALSLAAYVQVEWDLSERWSAGGGLRLEYSRYDYDNRMLDGSTRDDGTPCGFGGCIYSRPSDRSDHFTDLAPNLSLSYSLNDSTRLFTTLARGFRVPQMIELYRLQFGQMVSDMDSETIDSLELGLHTWHEAWTAELVAFAMRKRNSAFRDSEGFNVSGARSRHLGVELMLDWQFHENWMLHLNGAYGRHTWDFDESGRGEAFVSGNDIDSAPRWLGSAEVRYQPPERYSVGVQAVTLGEYYLDGQNRYTYPGHTLLNLRASFEATPTVDLFFRLYNVVDQAYADRSDHAMGDYRYLPGRGRELFMEIRYTPR